MAISSPLLQAIDADFGTTTDLLNKLKQTVNDCISQTDTQTTQLQSAVDGMNTAIGAVKGQLGDYSTALGQTQTQMDKTSDGFKADSTGLHTFFETSIGAPDGTLQAAHDKAPQIADLQATVQAGGKTVAGLVGDIQNTVSKASSDIETVTEKTLPAQQTQFQGALDTLDASVQADQSVLQAHRTAAEQRMDALAQGLETDVSQTLPPLYQKLEVFVLTDTGGRFKTDYAQVSTGVGQSLTDYNTAALKTKSTFDDTTAASFKTDQDQVANTIPALASQAMATKVTPQTGPWLDQLTKAEKATEMGSAICLKMQPLFPCVAALHAALQKINLSTLAGANK